MKKSSAAKQKIQIFYAMAFLIPFLSMVFLFILEGITPFGGTTFLKKDFYQQYTPFFYEYHRKLRQGESLFYSWNAGIGANFLAVIAYYLASPFNLLSLLLPESLILEFMTWMVVVKTGLCGLTMSHYLRKHYGRTDFSMTVFGFAYAFSAFMAAYDWNVMWMDVLMAAPLVILGLEILYLEGDPWLYAVSLCFSIFTNYYLSIMLCIFLVLWTAVLTAEYGFRKKALVRFAWYSLLSGGFGMILILPAAAALDFTTFTKIRLPQEIKVYAGPFDLLSRFLTAAAPETGLDHWPNLYCGIPLFFFLPLFFITRKIPLRKKLSRGALALFFLLSFDLNILEFFWHGLNFPDSLPARQSFLCIFLLLTMGYEAFRELRRCSRRELILSALTGGAILGLIILLSRDDGVDMVSRILSLLFALGELFLLFLCRIAPDGRKYRGNELRRISLFLFCCLFSAELLLNSCLTNTRSIQRDDYFSRYRDFKSLTDIVRTRNENFDEPLARTDEFRRSIRNHSMMLNHSSLSCFSSTNNGLITRYAAKYGLMSSRVFYLSDGTTPVTAAMMGQHYTLVPRNAVTSSDDTLTPLKYNNGAVLYQNLYALPGGYTVRTRDRGYFIPASEAENIIKGETGVLNDSLQPMDAENTLAMSVSSSGAIFHTTDFSGKDKDGTFYKEMEENAHLYIWNPEKAATDYKVTFSDGTPEKTWYTEKNRYILDLGFHRTGTSILFSPVNNKANDSREKEENIKGSDRNPEFLLRTLDHDALTSFVSRLNNAERLEEIEKSGTRLSGRIKMLEDGNLVLSVPYERGWKLFVDGKEEEIHLFDGLWISTPLTVGEHEVEIRFFPLGFLPGLLISGVSLLLLWLSLMEELQHRRKKHGYHKHIVPQKRRKIKRTNPR